MKQPSRRSPVLSATGLMNNPDLDQSPQRASDSQDVSPQSREIDRFFVLLPCALLVFISLIVFLPMVRVNVMALFGIQWSGIDLLSATPPLQVPLEEGGPMIRDVATTREDLGHRDLGVLAFPVMALSCGVAILLHRRGITLILLALLLGVFVWHATLGFKMERQYMEALRTPLDSGGPTGPGFGFYIRSVWFWLGFMAALVAMAVRVGLDQRARRLSKETVLLRIVPLVAFVFVTFLILFPLMVLRHDHGAEMELTGIELVPWMSPGIDGFTSDQGGGSGWGNGLLAMPILSVLCLVVTLRGMRGATVVLSLLLLAVFLIYTMVDLAQSQSWEIELFHQMKIGGDLGRSVWFWLGLGVTGATSGILLLLRYCPGILRVQSPPGMEGGHSLV